jgi:hypothetical protein
VALAVSEMQGSVTRFARSKRGTGGGRCRGVEEQATGVEEAEGGGNNSVRSIGCVCVLVGGSQTMLSL